MSDKFLQDIWYVAGFSDELKPGQIIGRAIAEHRLALFRDERGEPAAIGDRCPHRFAPLSLGTLENGRLSCRYHGLGFDRTGECVRNPHGAAGTSKLSVPSYPIQERDGLLWVWVGTAENADPTFIPTFERLGEEQHVRFGYIHGEANYQLMTDNILDLSHIEFLHPGLGSEAVSRAAVDVVVDADGLTTTRKMINEILPPNLQRVYRTDDRAVTRTLSVRWRAPATMILTVTIEDGKRRTGSQSLHLFTPESAHSTHYFYVASLDRSDAGADVADGFSAALGRVFVEEDKWIIDAQAKMIGDNDIMDLGPALLPIDKAPILARRKLRQLLDDEKAKSAA